MRHIQTRPLVAIALLTLFIMGCNQGQPNQVTSENKVNKCFLAVFENDTAYLSLEFAGEKVKGKMKIDYGNGELYDGDLSGVISGDTLLCKYDFKINNIDTWYRNPVALLNREDKLIMGDGKIMISLGQGVFDKSVPIDYENSRFTFEETSCPDQ
jgi:hypothetical protein